MYEFPITAARMKSSCRQAAQVVLWSCIAALLGGCLSTAAAESTQERQRLRELGYVEGKNIVIEWRYGEDKPDLVDQLAREDGADTPDEARSEVALDALGRANAVSLTAAAVWPAIRAAARDAKQGPLRVLDVASGGGCLWPCASNSSAIVPSNGGWPDSIS